MPEGKRNRKHEIPYLLNEGGSQGSYNESTSSASRSEVLAAAEAGGSSRRKRNLGQLIAAVPDTKVPRTSAATVVAASGRRRSTGPTGPTAEAPRTIAAVVTAGGRRRSTGPIAPTAEAPRISAAASSSGAAVSSNSDLQSEKPYVIAKRIAASEEYFHKHLEGIPKDSKLFNNLIQIGDKKSMATDESSLYKFYFSKPDYCDARRLYEEEFKNNFEAFKNFATKYDLAVDREGARMKRKRQRQAGKTRKGLSGKNR